MLNSVVILSAVSLMAWAYLAIFHGDFWKLLIDDKKTTEPNLWPSVDIIIPARNEADIIPLSLPSVLTQDYPGPWRIILVDDHSNDGTTSVAANIANRLGLGHKLLIIDAPPLKEGWSGKVAALNAGAVKSIGEYLLFTDADIKHPQNGLRRLVSKTVSENLMMNSLMVKLNCGSLAEKLLIPAFVHFFAMLYPFRLANDQRSRVAAAAGGVILIKREALLNIGGLESIKSALIDDCSLAAKVKKQGGANKSHGKIRISLTNDFLSLRQYNTFNSVWKMVARTAFTQLHHSAILLAGTVIGLGLLFLLPFLGVSVGLPLITEINFVSVLVMMGIYLPMVQFYGLSPLWALTLPIAGCIYIGATIDSAVQYWQGNGGNWKDRAQAST